MSNIFSKLRDFVGLNDPVEYEDEEDGDGYPNTIYPQQPQMTSEEEINQRRRGKVAMSSDTGMGQTMNNVIGMPGSGNSIYEVVVMEPKTFEEMPQAIQALGERKSVVLNLSMMEPEQAQRAVDFVAGGTFAMNGHQERVGENIFLFTPICVQVTTQSGVAHEAPPSQIRIPRPSSGNLAWTAESTRIAQQS